LNDAAAGSKICVNVLSGTKMVVEVSPRIAIAPPSGRAAATWLVSATLEANPRRIARLHH
jgi:hypothetical protein